MTQETTPLDETTVVPEAQPDKSATNATGGKTFTEAEVQELIKKRLAQQSGSERKKALEELGVEDVATDAELLKAARARREADKTEVEKAAGEAAKALKRAEELQVELDKERAERRIDARNRRILAAATELKAQIPDDVLAWAEKNAPAELDKALKEDGSVDDKAVQALVKACQAARPTWFGKGGVGSPSNAGGRTPSREVPKVKTSGRL